MRKYRRACYQQTSVQPILLMSTGLKLVWGVIGHAGSLKIAPFDRTQYEFLLAFHSNYVCIVLFLRYSEILIKIRQFEPIPRILVVPVGRDPVRISLRFLASVS